MEASLSVPEFHRVSGHPFGWPVADYTAGGESHPALKTRIQLLLHTVYDRQGEKARGKSNREHIHAFYATFLTFKN